MSDQPFLVDITPLRKQPGSTMRVERSAPMALAITDVEVVPGSAVTVDATLSWAQDDVVVDATITADWAGECRRCLERAGGQVRASVREVYEPGSDEEETYRLEGTRVDLAPLVRDAVLLGLPPAPLCSEGCRGLCPQCGANRNQGHCGCDDSPKDPRWAALDALQEDS